MQEFFADYGLWLLIALLVVIGLIFLLSGRSKDNEPAKVEKVIEASPPPAAAIAPEPIAVEPKPIPVAPEPVAAASPPPSPPPPVKAAPVKAKPVPAAPAVATPVTDEDDLARLKGVGPKLKTQLTALGVTRFAQIAAWTDSDIATIDAQLGTFKGRPVRDQWVDQAKYLASGDAAGFEAKYGKL
jgi:predicted flap endonuclease-1-like 5' DNA nuclease